MPKLAALGLTGIQFPEEYGGAAMSAVDYCICIEELARVCPAWRCRSRRTTASARRTSPCSAATEQKSDILPRLVQGEVLGAWGLTEAGAGQRRRRRCGRPRSRQGDSWVLNGSKSFITHGQDRRR